MRLTLDAAAQQAAWDGIRQYNGAVVAIEPATGRILAMATSPSYDPNPLSSNDPAGEPGGVETAQRRSRRSRCSTARSRARTRPGRSSRSSTPAAALSSGQYTPETEIPAPAALDLPGTTATICQPTNGGPASAAR